MIRAASNYPLLDVFWTMLIFFFWMIWIYFLIVIFSDLFSRRDIGGWGKAGWTVLLVVLPYLGVLIYLIGQSGGMAERRAAQAEASKASFDSYVRSVAASDQGKATNEIERAKGLLDSGAITTDEYEALKHKALAS